MPAPPNPGFSAAQGMAPSPSFGQQMQGLNSTISPFTSSLRDITRNFAAGFARDPAVREQYSQQNAVRDESKRREDVARRQQSIETIMGNFNAYAEAIRGARGNVTPGLQAAMDQAGELLVELGVPPQEAELLKNSTIEIGRIPPEAAQPDYQNVIGPDGTPLGMIDVNDPNQITALPPGAQLTGAAEGLLPDAVLAQKKQTAGGTNINFGGMFGAGAFAPVQEGQITNLQEETNKTSANIAEIQRTLDAFESDAGKAAAGVSGVVAETVGGLSQQLLGTEGAYGPLGGPKIEDVRSVRTQATALVGRLLPAVTGDTSGRYTEQDQQRITAASAAMDPKASVEVVKKALGTLLDIEKRAAARARIKLKGLDVRSDEGTAEYAKELKSLYPGWSDEKAVDEALRDFGQ